MVDASVILKWVLPKSHAHLQEQALAVREVLQDRDGVLMAPSLWRYEVGNTLCRLYPAQSIELLRLCEAHGIVETHPEGWQEVAGRLTRKYGVTFYDASYHALAIQASCTFITADDKYVDRTRKEGAVQRLAEFRAE